MAHKLRQKTVPGVLKVAKYQVLGRSIAGSFFVECLLREAGIDYDFIHISRRQSREESFLAENPLGRIPVLITPGGERIIESMAIFTHLVEAFPGLAPAPGDPAFGQNDRGSFLKNAFAKRCRHDPLPRAHHQLKPQPALHQLHVSCQGRLRQPERRRRTGKGSGADDFVELQQMPWIYDAHVVSYQIAMHATK